MSSYKPKNYNSLSPYLIVDDAEKLVELLKIVFDAKEIRRYDREDGSIMHIELQLDDSVVMISDSTEDYPAITAMLHIYVPDVFKTFDLAIKNDCLLLERPVSKADESDTRGAFLDYAGNYWSVSTQIEL
ncbi:VOC family protein [Gelidibacter pelagius]|uniref:VOC family protein n=1 Tax=Gelidibacter pelagius TaxID=2819985 RepID=A0ABS3SRB8_9FLAO|nr:VOC family protein [Gelidibacter pelagius]MBO3097492.1 VOC family protein [Gelidibacter pelagius]